MTTAQDVLEELNGLDEKVLPLDNMSNEAIFALNKEAVKYAEGKGNPTSAFASVVGLKYMDVTYSNGKSRTDFDETPLVRLDIPADHALVKSVKDAGIDLFSQSYKLGNYQLTRVGELKGMPVFSFKKV